MLNQMKNQTFCYWLQGYFEIASKPVLEKKQVVAITEHLSKISEPFGIFTGWLSEVCDYIKEQDYRQATMDHFMPIIRFNLNGIFEHVIDVSYESDKSQSELQDIHDGRAL